MSQPVIPAALAGCAGCQACRRQPLAARSLTPLMASVLTRATLLVFGLPLLLLPAVAALTRQHGIALQGLGVLATFVVLLAVLRCCRPRLDQALSKAQLPA